MPYQIQPDERLSMAIPRILREETDLLISFLTQEDDLHYAVHEARKCCKRIRAVWRLIRDTIDKKSYRLENQTYRDASRRLSGLRDLSALLEALETIPEEDMPPHVYQVWDRSRQDLMVLRQQAEERMSRELLHEIAQEIRLAQKRIDQLALPSDKFKIVEKGFHRVYRRGHRAMRKAYRNPDAEKLHDWRKRVKYLRFHIQLLALIWPNMMKALGDELHQLSDLLGDHHDLVVLSAFLNEEHIVAEPKDGKKPFVKMLTNRQRAFERDSFLLGERLYLSRPADFVFTTRQYWELWQHQTAQQKTVTPGG